MSVHRFLVPTLTGLLVLSGSIVGAVQAQTAGELTGHVKSVARDLKTIVVTQSGTDKDVTVTINGRTKIVTTEGRPLEAKDIKPGDGVGIAHTNSVASEVKVSVGRAVVSRVEKLTGHVKSIAPDHKTIVVRESGTDKDITVTVNGRTKVTTTEGRMLELKDLKPGDGVGIVHQASVASEIKVSLKPGT
ncbi:MAG: hypothetical protein ABI353_23460 [Isosphaeraceae bacterium]